MRWTEDDLRRLQLKTALVTPSAPPRTKYGSQAVYEEGERYDSKLELRCSHWLHLRKAAGEVLWFIRQVNFRLEGGVKYRADYLAALANGGIEVIDATGFMTPMKANKLKGMKERYGIEVKLWKDALGR